MYKFVHFYLYFVLAEEKVINYTVSHFVKAK